MFEFITPLFLVSKDTFSKSFKLCYKSFFTPFPRTRHVPLRINRQTFLKVVLNKLREDFKLYH